MVLSIPLPGKRVPRERGRPRATSGVVRGRVIRGYILKYTSSEVKEDLANNGIMGKWEIDIRKIRNVHIG